MKLDCWQDGRHWEQELDMPKKLTIVDFLVLIGFTKSRSEAKRLIKQKAVRIWYQK